MLAIIANVAEIIGVILVVVTLVFLTLQIRQNTRALKATTTQNVMQGESAMAAVLVEHADVWNKIVTSAPLAPGVETRRAITLFNLYMIDTENRYHQFKTGYLDAQPWQGRIDTLPTVVHLPVFKIWRKSLGGQSHSADFLQLLDDLVVNNNEAQ